MDSIGVRGDRRNLPGQRLLLRSGSVTPPCHPELSWPTERSATPGAALEGGERLVECAGDAWQVPAVDETTVKLATQLAEQTDPLIVTGCPRGGLRCRGDDDPLDDLDSGKARGGRAGLLPRAVPAGRRTPLRNRAPGPESDRTTAPAACGRRGPSRTCARRRSV
jgi:hypothetical protein